MTDVQLPTAVDRPHPRRAGIRPLIAAAALGLAVLYLVGFAGSHSIHEAAHDARHTLNFPCH
jgi:cobalt transporter subunit CbtB